MDKNFKFVYLNPFRKSEEDPKLFGSVNPCNAHIASVEVLVKDNRTSNLSWGDDGSILILQEGLFILDTKSNTYISYDE